MAKKQTKKKPEPKETTTSPEALTSPSEANPQKPWLVGGIIILVVAAAFFAVLYGTRWWHDRSIVSYNGFEFVPVDEYWETTLTIDQKPYVIQFHRLPNDVDFIPYDPSAKTIITDKPSLVYITTDPDYPSKAVIAGVEIAKILGTAYDIYNLKVKAALTRPIFSQANASQLVAPVATCADANETTAVIIIHIGDTTRVAQNEGCIIIEGATSDDTIRAADRFAYGLLGIIP